MDAWLERWKLDERRVHERLYGAPTARERERWHAVWLVARGWSAARVAEALERDAHAIGAWVARFRASEPDGLIFEQTGGAPCPRRGAAGRGESGDSGRPTRRRDRLGGLVPEVGTKARVQQHVGQFFHDIVHRTAEVKHRCRRTLQAQADALAPIINAILHQSDHGDPTLALV